MPLRHCATKGCEYQALMGAWCQVCAYETPDRRWEDTPWRETNTPAG